MPADELVVHGAREHNLKDVTVRLPRNALICITGLSGSGKSSLAFDTIYAEGQRRYVESLSAYARQFLQMMEKPDVDSIDGLSPAISIDQKTTSRNPRSTVGTVTEIYDYLRLLWSRVGHPHCYNCGRPIEAQSAEQIVDQVMMLPEGSKFMVLAPVVRSRKGEYKDLFDHLRSEGFTRVQVDGELKRRMFSFNSPHGACPRCTGLGSQMEIDPDLVVPDPSLSLAEGAILPWSTSASNYYEQMTQAIAEKWEVDLETPWEDLPERVRHCFLYGTNGG